MKLDYHILWFEDDDYLIKETHGPEIEKFIITLGLNPKIDHRDNGKSLASLIQSGNINSYDLIVTDLDLGDGNETGKHLINHIREERIFTDVLLYSASDEDMEKIIQANGWVERASFCIGVGPLREKLKNLIRLTLNKQQDVNNTRGLFIAETILLEKKIERVILEYFKETEELALPADRALILNKIRDGRIKSSQGQAQMLAALQKIDLDALIKKGIITAAHTTDALISILNKRAAVIGDRLSTKGIFQDDKDKLTAQRQDILNLKEELVLFQEEILSIRNTLAHVEESTDEKGLPCLISRKANGKTIVFEPNQYAQMRLDLRRHNANLEKIIQHLAE